MKKIFALVDCNNFFVSCERLFAPYAMNKPAVVYSGNQGCVIARSNEAKAIGIKMGEPVYKCKEILDFFEVYGFTTNFSLYSDISQRVMEIVSKYGHQFEQYSIDEGFLDITDIKVDDYEKFGRSIKDEIFKLVGIPVSVGISYTKTLCKIASKKAKKRDGVYILLNNIADEIASLDISDVWGIGWASTKYMRRYGINNVGDFLLKQASWVLKHFSVNMLKTWWELKGENANSIEEKKSIPKSMMHSRTFMHPILEKEILRERLMTFAVEIGRSLRLDGLMASNVHIFIAENRMRKGYFSSELSDSFLQHTNLDTEISQKVGEMFDHIFRNGMKYKRAGVLVSGIIKESEYVSLFKKDNLKKELAQKAVDIVNNRYKDKVKLASTRLNIEKAPLQSGSYTTDWNQLYLVF
jgi:DNA polymerase V